MMGAASKLPEKVTDALARLNAGLRANRVDRQALGAALTAINALDPRHVPAAEAGFRRHVDMPAMYWKSARRIWIQVPFAVKRRVARWLGMAPAIRKRPEPGYVVYRDGTAHRKLLARQPDLALIFLRHSSGFVR